MALGCVIHYSICLEHVESGAVFTQATLPLSRQLPIDSIILSAVSCPYACMNKPSPVHHC